MSTFQYGATCVHGHTAGQCAHCWQSHHQQIIGSSISSGIISSQTIYADNVNALEILKELGPLLTATQIGILQTSSTKVVRDYVKTIIEERERKKVLDEALQVLGHEKLKLLGVKL